MNKTSHLTLREKGRLRVSAKCAEEEIFGAKDKVTGSGEDSIRKSFMICTAQQILFG